MESIEFIINFENIDFGSTTLYDLINNDPTLFKVAILNYNDDNNQIEVFSNFDKFSINDNTITIWTYLSTEKFTSKNPITLYGTYTVIYQNEMIPLKPDCHNYIFDIDYEKEGCSYSLLTDEDLKNPIHNKANAILNKWLYQDSLKIENNLIDSHSHFRIEKDRKIILQGEDKNILLTKDNDSEEITFEILQEYDGIDLSTKNLSIYYITPKKDTLEFQPQGKIESLHIEEIKNGYIYATWVVSDLATEVPGVITFAIIAEGDGLIDEYFWQTYPSQLIVEKGIYESLPGEEKDFSFIEKEDFRSDIYQDVEELKEYHEAGQIKWQSLADLVKQDN